MLKLMWLLLLGVLLHASLVTSSSIERTISRRTHHDCEEEDEKPAKPKTTTKSITTTRTTTTSHTKHSSTPAPYFNGTTSCEHSCNDSPCRHVCQDGPCHKTCTIPPPLYEPQVVAAAVLLMLIGVYLMAYGFPFFTVTMAMTGFLLGSGVTWICLHAVEPANGYPIPSTFYLCCCVGGGLFLAVFSIFCWKVAIYLLCGMAGYLLSIYIWTWKEDYIIQNILIQNIIGLSLGFLFILGFVLIEFATVILSISFIGSYVFVLGLDLFIKSGFVIGLKNILDFNKHYHRGVYLDFAKEQYKIDIKVYGMMCAVIGLWVVSTTWQRYFNRGNRFGLRVIENTNNTLKIK